MKNFVLVFLLVFLSCKNEKKMESEIVNEKLEETDIEINQSPSEMWIRYIESFPENKDAEIPESDFFHNNRDDANRLAELTLLGRKRASSGLYSLYRHYNIDLPSVGSKEIITDFDGNAKVIIENVSVDTIPFNKVSKEYAELDMGTDMEPLEKWKKEHWDFFEIFLKENGEEPTKEMLVVCVRFKKIWPL